MFVKNQAVFALVLALLVSLIAEAQQQYMQVVSSAEPTGKTPQQLAAMLIDQASGIQLVGTVTTTINAPNDPSSNLRAMGEFTGGLTAAGTLLPPENQPDPNNPTVTYAGGVGIASGVCLCTGVASDNDPQIDPNSVPEGLGVGMQGPNNGHPLANAGVIGEIDFELAKPGDQDFANIVAPGLDATVLNFDIELQTPGILRMTYVHGTDEYPFFLLASFNDTFLVFIRDPDFINPQFRNFIHFRARNPDTGEVEEKTLSLQDLQECNFLKDNLVAPRPTDLLTSRHADFDGDGVVEQHELDTPRFDHEFAGFSKPLTFEAYSPLPTSPLYRCALAPGRYNIKMVIQDVPDDNLDSAAFIAAQSLKLFPLQQGDYNGSGCVDAADYNVWVQNYGKTNACFYDGDGSGNAKVDTADYVTWRSNLGASGNTDFRSDFNRNGSVDNQDLALFGQYYNVLTHCASRFEGDADGDGDVDDDDYAILVSEYPSSSCGCNCAESLNASGGDSLASLKERLPESPDVDGDGDVDDADFAALNAIVHGSDSEEAAIEGSGSEPTAAEFFPSTDAPQPTSAQSPDEQSLLPPAPSGLPRR